MIFETVATGGCRSYVIGREESCAAAIVPFMSLGELKARLESGTDDLVVLDVRERIH